MTKIILFLLNLAVLVYAQKVDPAVASDLQKANKATSGKVATVAADLDKANADRAAVVQAGLDNAAVAAYRQEERLANIENILASEAAAKQTEAANDQKQRQEILSRCLQVLVALIIALVMWLAKGTYTWITDAIRYRAEALGRTRAGQASKLQLAKLDQIHTLVNSNMTAAMENELDAREANLVSLEQIVALQKASGIASSSQAQGVMDAQRIKITELKAQLKDRLAATNLASKELKDSLGHEAE